MGKGGGGVTKKYEIYVAIFFMTYFYRIWVWGGGGAGSTCLFHAHPLRDKDILRNE